SFSTGGTVVSSVAAGGCGEAAAGTGGTGGLRLLPFPAAKGAHGRQIWRTGGRPRLLPSLPRWRRERAGCGSGGRAGDDGTRPSPPRSGGRPPCPRHGSGAGGRREAAPPPTTTMTRRERRRHHRRRRG
ncbi:Os07g0255900, partial [Oryza sativa Japonica Group]